MVSAAGLGPIIGLTAIRRLSPDHTHHGPDNRDRLPPHEGVSSPQRVSPSPENMIQEVRLLDNYRGQFARIIQGGSFQDLLKSSRQDGRGVQTVKFLLIYQINRSSCMNILWMPTKTDVWINLALLLPSVPFSINEAY